MSPRSDSATPPALKARSADAAAGLKNLHQLIQLRWIAVIGQIFTIEVAHYSLNLALPLREMLMVVGCLAAFNVVSFLRWRTGRGVRNVELFLALLVDVAVLTVQLYLSGGASNPFVFLYLLQITLGAALLRSAYVWGMVLIAALCVVLLTRYALPLPLAPDFSRGLASPYVLGLLVCFMLNAGLVVIFIHRIGRNLRQRDTRLAAIRQRAAEEEHIVRMGLLASGAAHELGTPCPPWPSSWATGGATRRWRATPRCRRKSPRCRPRCSAARPSSAASCCRPARRAARPRPRPPSASSSTRWRATGAPRAR